MKRNVSPDRYYFTLSGNMIDVQCMAQEEGIAPQQIYAALTKTGPITRTATLEEARALYDSDDVPSGSARAQAHLRGIALYYTTADQRKALITPPRWACREPMSYTQREKRILGNHDRIRASVAAGSSSNTEVLLAHLKRT